MQHAFVSDYCIFRQWLHSKNKMSLTCFHIHVSHGPGLSVGAACLRKRNSNPFSFIHPAISAILRNVRNEFLFQLLGEGCLNFEPKILIFYLYFHYLQNDYRQSLYDVFWSTQRKRIHYHKQKELVGQVFGVKYYLPAASYVLISVKCHPSLCPTPSTVGKDGDIGKCPISQYRKKKWQILKYPVENQ